MSDSGDCYRAAAASLMSLGCDSGGLLAHAEVTGQGVIAGLRYGHAWMEIGDSVIDQSNGRTVCMRQDAYYELGNIEPESVRRYSWREAMALMTQTGHYGPWEEVVR